MKQQKTITILVGLISLLAIAATTTGIFSDGGPGPYQYESIRGNMITIYGEGVYQHMSAEVAPQGIAQEYVTLFIGVPLLLFSFIWARNGSLRGRFLLAGTLGYFLVTYLFYLVMGMYNILFLVYAGLLGTSFFALALTLLSFNLSELPSSFSESTPVKSTGGFLIFNSIAIGVLWLGIVVPPLVDGTIIPREVEHYTTLIVQGLDLGLLLPLAFVSGLLFIRKKRFGYLLAPVYFGFLSVLMTALTAKIIAMAMAGSSVIPAVFIIPVFNIVSVACLVLIMKNISR